MDDSEDRKTVIDYCRKCLNGKWITVTDQQVEINFCTGGIANRVYHCRLKDIETVDPETKYGQVMVHLNGSRLLESVGRPKFMGDAQFAVTQYILSQGGLAPKVLAFMEDGRIEEHIENAKPPKSVLHSRDVDIGFARIIARIHSFTMPTTKEPKFISTIMDLFVLPNLDRFLKGPDSFPSEDEEKTFKVISQHDLKTDIKWMYHMIKQVKPGIVYCHNDCHLNNCLFKIGDKPIEDRMTFIDYELSGYNYRAYDLAFFINFRYFHINDDPIPRDEIKFPDDEVRKLIVSEYLKTIQKIDPEGSKDLDEKRLMIELDLMQVVSHLVYICFALMMINKKQSSFGEYTLVRYERYLHEKKQFIEKYSSLYEMKIE